VSFDMPSVSEEKNCVSGEKSVMAFLASKLNSRLMLIFAAIDISAASEQCTSVYQL
jgi:hypothetical protein